jgi:ectoine hydroxylase
VRSAEKLLGGEASHYHSKMIMNDARVGGAWTWHQDNGSWYQNGVLFPPLVSVSIAVDLRKWQPSRPPSSRPWSTGPFP